MVLESKFGITREDTILKCEDLKNESIYWVNKMAQFMVTPSPLKRKIKVW